MRVLIRYFYILLLALCAFANPAQALSVDAVRFGLYPDKTRIVIDLSEPADFRAFVLENPGRVVLDLPDLQWKAGQVQKIARITGLRHGLLQPGIMRIIFETPQGVGIKDAFPVPRAGAKPDRLVIDFGPAATDADLSSQTYGALRAGTPGAPDEETGTVIKNDKDQAPHASPAPTPSFKGKKPLIVIDAGHGGDDPGARGVNGTYEKNVTLALAKNLKKQLLDTGRYNVLLTRETDKFIILKERVNIARRAGADLFVSIHADSIQKPDVSGASMYTLSNKASDEQSAKLAARENKADMIAGLDLNVEDKEVADILVDLARRDTMNQSRYFSKQLVISFHRNNVNLLESPGRFAGFAVLKAPDIPSVLVESGYMSNQQESVLLNTDSYRTKLAGALKNGIDAYFEQVRKNQRL